MALVRRIYLAVILPELNMMIKFQMIKWDKYFTFNTLLQIKCNLERRKNIETNNVNLSNLSSVFHNCFHTIFCSECNGYLWFHRFWRLNLKIEVFQEMNCNYFCLKHSHWFTETRSFKNQLKLCDNSYLGPPWKGMKRKGWISFIFSSLHLSGITCSGSFQNLGCLPCIQADHSMRCYNFFCQLEWNTIEELHFSQHSIHLEEYLLQSNILYQRELEDTIEEFHK